MTMADPSGSPIVSIVVNTYNRAAWLDDALRGLAGLDYPAFEVIVVNGPSTDDSAAVIARWAQAVRAVACPEAKLALSRNLGIAAAAGDVIAFIDDDAVPHPQWLRHLVAGYHDPRVGAVGGYTVDHTGTRWQMRKVLCDRYGEAYEVSDFFDERPLNRPGTPFYPSLLGTNCSFRASALRAIGGFDHAFAYLLDETDVCLRLVDAGWHVRFEPEALVWHQFAPSHIRSPERVARTLYPSSVSKGYFITRHGGATNLAGAGEALDRHRNDVLARNAHLHATGAIDAGHRHALDQDLVQGLRDGQRRAMASGTRPGGDLPDLLQIAPPFRRFAPPAGRRVVLVCHDWQGQGGIARWTELVARGLAARGHQIHVLARAEAEETIRFAEGLWLHRLCPDPAPGASPLPPRQAAWAERIRREVQFLKSFGIDLVQFPIWDLEGLPLLDDPDLTCVVSLHTTYAMARPHKPEWLERPLLAARQIEPMIAAETALLARAPHLLANSTAIVPPGARAHVIPHGTPDPWTTRVAAHRDHAPLHVAFVGRFEPRKGFDIAVGLARAILDMPNVEMTFAGGTLDADTRRLIAQLGAEAVLDHPRVAFRDVLSRAALDDLYVASDLVVMPSRFESFGLVAIEAMAAGVPVLALDRGGLGEIARPQFGARAFPETPDLIDRLAAEVAWLNTDRDELATRAAQARAAWQAHFTTTAMIDAIEAWYETLLAPTHLTEAAE
jgi:glycosyltransferase involved in cell wall biosynthesis/GT2 family glycosyltransferase